MGNQPDKNVRNWPCLQTADFTARDKICILKGSLIQIQPTSSHAIEGETFKVTLRDANWKEVATKEFKTNKFGSFNGEFTLPQQTLGGMFTLSTEYQSVNVRVEEYKRPTFFIDLLPVKGEITFGDLVTIQGKAQTFSGISRKAERLLTVSTNVPSGYVATSVVFLTNK